MAAGRTYPDDYRGVERQAVLTALRAGDCAAVIGLSGAGKSNFLRSLMDSADMLELLLVDCNRLRQAASADFLALLFSLLAPESTGEATLARVETALADRLAEDGRLTLVFDRFEVMLGQVQGVFLNHLRVLRDAFKYRLTYLIAMRHPLPLENELSELFFANTIWLGPLKASDACWSIRSYFERYGRKVGEEEMDRIMALSGRYPAFLRAVCEAYRVGTPLSLEVLSQSPPVRARLEEFWRDDPDERMLEKSGLAEIPLLAQNHPLQVDETRLTAKEQALWLALKENRGEVCEKDDLIRSVWPEDVIFERGVRDDSLAQLVRRLREKIEVDPSSPEWIITVPGRGYLLSPDGVGRG